MNYIKPISEFLSEAISMKMYKENLPKELWYKKPPAYKKWTKIFGKGVNRISIPLNSSPITLPTSTPLMEEINSVFIPLGYKINSFEDYLNNKVYKISDTKNPMKIGGLLNKINPDLFGIFDTSLERKEWKDKINNSDKDLKIVISRHPYDLLGMASGRDWSDSSCMRLGTTDDKVYKLLGFYENEGEGANKDYISKDITEGTLIAYVVNIDDNNINKPLSRLLIKPYVNEKDSNDIIWVSADKLYGQEVEGFKSSVDEWLGGWQGEKYGYYCIKGGLYADEKERVQFYKPIDKWTDKDREDFLKKVCGGRWKMNDKGEIDVYGNVIMVDMNLTEIPVKFGRIDSGGFYCQSNKLTTLKNCPTYVGRDFKCYNNQLTTLEFAPITVVGGFDCYTNRLTSLVGCPTTVVDYFNCSNNNLTSLEGCNVGVGDSGFYCHYNYLTSLKFAPKKVDCGGDFNCANNNLTSLVGFPVSVEGWVDCSKQKNGHKFTEEEVREICQFDKFISLEDGKSYN
jgi:hypothetical protein